MKLTTRRYQSDDDYWSIRQFLRDVFVQNDRRELGWPLYRWDYWRWFVNDHVCHFNLRAALFLWHTSDGSLAAVLHPDGPGEALLEVAPTFRSPELEVELMTMAETHYAVQQPAGTQQLTIWAHAGDALRQQVLQRRGYRRGAYPVYQRRRSLDVSLPTITPPPGYTIRTLGDTAEHPARSWLAWQAVHPDRPAESYTDEGWYRHLQRAPLYRRDLDLVAVAPNGELAAFCTLWFDDATRSAAIEPLGTHPAHRRRGLARAIISAGLEQVRDMGATLCTVDSSSEAPGACVVSLGFNEYDLIEPWSKQW
jgi:mycothiol synthase